MRNNESAPSGESDHEMTTEVPKSYAARFSQLVGLTDGFCDAHLNAEYKHMCRKMAETLCQDGSPVTRGKPEGWAAGIVYALGQVNFLTDPSQTPHMTAADIAKGLGVSTATMQAKAKVIREGLDLVPFDPDWCLPSNLETIEPRKSNVIGAWAQVPGFAVQTASRRLHYLRETQ